MADITWDNVTSIDASLSAVPVDAQAEILAYVNETVAPDKFGGEASARYRLARIFLAAHYGTVTLAQGNTPAGPVVSESVGDVSRTYGFAAAAGTATPGSDLLSTGWGREYHSLVRRSGAARAPLVT